MAEEFQRAERQQLDHIRSMLDPIADIRKSLMFDSGYRKLMEEIERPSFLNAELERAARETSHFDHVAKAMQESMQSSFSHAQEMIAATGIRRLRAIDHFEFKLSVLTTAVVVKLVVA